MVTVIIILTVLILTGIVVGLIYFIFKYSGKSVIKAGFLSVAVLIVTIIGLNKVKDKLDYKTFPTYGLELEKDEIYSSIYDILYEESQALSRDNFVYVSPFKTIDEKEKRIKDLRIDADRLYESIPTGTIIWKKVGGSSRYVGDMAKVQSLRENADNMESQLVEDRMKLARESSKTSSNTEVKSMLEKISKIETTIKDLEQSKIQYYSTIHGKLTKGLYVGGMIVFILAIIGTLILIFSLLGSG